jgi:hypothetical protein
MSYDVFISYSHHDKSAADAVCAKLEQHGIRCWIAPRDVAPGTEWAGSIIHAISRAKIMVLVFSKNANDSPQIRKEVERAVNKGVIVVPLRIEDVPPTESLEYFMSNVHWLDALTPPLEQHLNNLADTIRILLDRAATVHEPPLRTPEAPPKINSAKSNWPTIVIAAVVLLALALAVIHFTPKTNSQPHFVHDRDIPSQLGDVNVITFGPDGKWLAEGRGDGTIVFFDPANGSYLRSITGQTSGIHTLAFSADGRQVASSGDDKIILLRDATSGGILHALKTDSVVTSLAFSPDGKTLAAGDGYLIVLWRLAE